MNSIAITIQNRRVDEALRRLPGVIEQRVDAALDRAAQEFAREAKLRAPKARSTLMESVISRRLGAMHFEVTTGTNYALAVEEGTGPAVGKPSYMPNPLFLQDYVKQRSGVALAGRRGSAQRESAEREIRGRAWALAVYIRRHGTKPHPFMEPTRRVMEPRIRDSVGDAVESGVKEAFGV